MYKTDYCGRLRASDAGRAVKLAGWVHRRRDHGGLIFIDLRDSQGIVQVVINPAEAPDAHATASSARNEYVLQVSGEVRPRAPQTVNPKMATGEIEVAAGAVTVLNAAKTPPFYINEPAEVDELTRLKYRYLDLRREEMQANLRLRHRVVKYIRDFLSERDFVEIETPTLVKSTPEGARDFLVPSRLHAGQFFALPQSPQQLKQLLMVAGFERYFQIARCWRDEDLRADRQPEFTQLDLEMSFTDEEEVLGLMEELYTGLSETVRPDLKLVTPFPRLPYAEVMERYGSDKPDLRYGLELTDVSAELEASEVTVFRSVVAKGGVVKGMVVAGGAEFTRKQIDELIDHVKQAGAGGLVSIALGGDGSLDGLTKDDVRSQVARVLTLEEVLALARKMGAGRGDVILLVADQKSRANTALDSLRRDVARRQGLVDHSVLHYAFITEFPLVEWSETEDRWDAAHHPFTAPHPDDVGILESDPGAVRSRAYDLTCNGWELGSGSIRIHDRALQERVFSLLRVSKEQQQERFGHMLEAFEYGAPPHGGFAPGIDRTVAILAGVLEHYDFLNIREVIAFPKTQSMSDPMMGAPSPVDAAQLNDLGLSLK
jgi:aspartyl-tRNA synthetase